MSLAEKTILVVDDHPDTLEMVECQLRHMGFVKVRTARTAYAALQIAVADTPDLVLMDIVLPGIDGLEATRRLKTDARTSHIPVLAITANVMADDENVCLQNGCDRYLPKPCSYEQLKQAIEEIFSRSAAAAS